CATATRFRRAMSACFATGRSQMEMAVCRRSSSSSGRSAGDPGAPTPRSISGPPIAMQGAPMPDETFFFDRLKTPLGEMIIVAGEDGALRMTWFEDGNGRWQKAFARLYEGTALVAKRDPSGLSSSLKSYFDGDVFVLDRMPAVFGGTPFQN